MITPRYLVDSTVFSFLPSILSLVSIFLFFGENTMAMVLSGLNVKLASRLFVTKGKVPPGCLSTEPVT